MSRADHAAYTIQEGVAKWLREDTIPRPGSGLRYIPEVGAYGDFVFITLRDAMEYTLPPEEPPRSIDISWYRFGLSDLSAVPAWRQSLFAAAMMIDSNPSAALVLIASGFEAFFTETMRIKWLELGLRAASFKNVVASQRIASLVEWMPGAVGMPALPEASDDLHQRWRSLVNGRRNAVVHRANVHFTSEQAIESLRCALECISSLDSLALFRPHPYYAGE